MTSVPKRPINVSNMEVHVAHACNLTCQSCAHYSDYSHKGVVPVMELDAWMAHWAHRIHPVRFSLLGGEPTIHPSLCDIILVAREHFPRSLLRLVTNAGFLHRHPRLPEVMLECGNIVLEISIHHDSPEYLSAVSSNLLLAKSWAEEFDIAVSIKASHSGWTARYRGLGKSMEPFNDGDNRRSWEICKAKHCLQLFEGRLWKCAAVAYFDMQDEKFGLSDNWDAYRSYRPLAPDCSDDELREFLGREHESICGLCPAYDRPLEKPLPLKTRVKTPVTDEAQLDPFVRTAISGVISARAARLYKNAK